MVTDVHAHCIPEAFRSWLGVNGDRVGASVVPTPRGDCVQFADGPRTGPQFSWQSLSDRQARVEAMDRMGIDIQVLAGWIDLTGYELELDVALEYARVHNECLAEEAATDPDRFRSIGTAPLQDPGLAVAGLEHAMDELGMLGVQIASRVGETTLGSDEDLEDFWAAAAERRALVVLHPLRPLEGVDLDRYFLDNAVGRPAESSIAVAGLIMSGVFERNPGLRVCVVHGGGFLPYQVGRLDRAYEKAQAVAAKAISRQPSSFLDQVDVDTIVHDSSALRFVVDRLGADHVLVGTDYPFPMGDEDPVALVRSVSSLTDTQRDAILSENARRWLG